MTIIEAITKVDELKPNGYQKIDKIKWLSMLDSMIKKDIIDTHEGGDNIEFAGYDESTPIDTKLIAYEPYEELYLVWLESKIDYYNAEYVKYNNAITKHNELYEAFQNDYNRSHMPKGKQMKYF